MQLAVDHLTVKRGIRPVLKNVSFSLVAGDGLLITGHNGSGKTTLLRTIAGFLPAFSGTIKLEDTKALDEELCDLVHYIGHLNGIKSTLTVVENLSFWYDFFTPKTHASLPERQKNIKESMDRFELTGLKDIPSGYLSAGQKRRLCLARLILVKRPVWILDEPTVSLDTHSVDILAREVSAHIDGGGIVLAATHIPLGVKFNRSLTLEAGHIVEMDSIAITPSPDQNITDSSLREFS